MSSARKRRRARRRFETSPPPTTEARPPPPREPPRRRSRRRRDPYAERHAKRHAMSHAKSRAKRHAKSRARARARARNRRRRRFSRMMPGRRSPPPACSPSPRRPGRSWAGFCPASGASGRAPRLWCVLGPSRPPPPSTTGGHRRPRPPRGSASRGGAARGGGAMSAPRRGRGRTSRSGRAASRSRWWTRARQTRGRIAATVSRAPSSAPSRRHRRVSRSAVGPRRRAFSRRAFWQSGSDPKRGWFTGRAFLAGCGALMDVDATTLPRFSPVDAVAPSSCRRRQTDGVLTLPLQADVSPASASRFPSTPPHPRRTPSSRWARSP